MKDFLIPYKGLRLGEHVFEWDLNKKFFEAYENSDILDCRLKVVLNLNKRERMLELNFSIAGNVTLACDRCLAPLKMPVDIGENYYIKFGTERKEESEDVMIIPETDYQIDVAPLIFDYVSLSIPMKKVHGQFGGSNTCDKAMISKLENLNSEKGTDPRWDALKEIKLENDN